MLGSILSRLRRVMLPFHYNTLRTRAHAQNGRGCARARMRAHAQFPTGWQQIDDTFQQISQHFPRNCCIAAHARACARMRAHAQIDNTFQHIDNTYQQLDDTFQQMTNTLREAVGMCCNPVGMCCNPVGMCCSPAHAHPRPFCACARMRKVL